MKKKTNLKKQSESTLQTILNNGDVKEIRALFHFDSSHTDKEVVFKFNVWTRFFHAKFFKSKDAPFHAEIDMRNVRLYRGKDSRFIDIAFRGAAKRQPLTAKILTPKGFTTLGQLKVGDFVIGSDGKPVEVEFMSEVIDRPIYKVETEDGRSTECDSEHLWTVRKMSNVKDKNITITTQKIIDDGLFYERFDRRYPDKKYLDYKFALETVAPVQLEKKDLPLDPYLVGVLLGDGSMSKEWGGARLHFHKDDDLHYRNQLDNYIVTDTKYDKRNTNVGRFGISGIGKDIIKLGMNVNCYNKFIPTDYLYGDVSQRKAVLEGLMDTDGTVGLNRKTGGNTPSFSTVSEKLADGVVELVRSLGGRASKNKRNGCIKLNGKPYWRIGIMFTDYKPFRLKRKLDRCNFSNHTFSRIVSIKLVGNKLGRCIKIKNSDGLYVTDDYLLTHNTTRTKLFAAFAISNDMDHFRRYIKVLSADSANSQQIVTDVYNLLIKKVVLFYYPEIFMKTVEKREEKMSVFTTSTGVKMQSDSVGTDQRGDIQDDARPDFIWFDDFETRKTLRSAVITHAIKDNMQEAVDGLSITGGALYNCNYLSERGNVHTLVLKSPESCLITPIKGSIVNGTHVDGPPTWPAAYTPEQVETKLANTDDPAGEYLCTPSAGADVLFDRKILEKQEAKTPIRTIADFKIFHAYDPSHRYGSGHDVAGGVGLDSSTSVFIDFTTYPSKVVATFRSNTMRPNSFGHEIANQADRFGRPKVAVENNKFDECIGVLKRKNDTGMDIDLFFTEIDETIVGMPPRRRYFGWNTNSDTKPKMMFALKKAIEDGHLELSDPELTAEAKSYGRDDLMDSDEDVRLTTRHFDLLIACAIAYQMKDHAEVMPTNKGQDYKQSDYEQPGLNA